MTLFTETFDAPAGSPYNPPGSVPVGVGTGVTGIGRASRLTADGAGALWAGTGPYPYTPVPATGAPDHEWNGADPTHPVPSWYANPVSPWYYSGTSYTCEHTLGYPTDYQDAAGAYTVTIPAGSPGPHGVAELIMKPSDSRNPDPDLFACNPTDDIGDLTPVVRWSQAHGVEFCLRGPTAFHYMLWEQLTAPGDPLPTTISMWIRDRVVTVTLDGLKVMQAAIRAVNWNLTERKFYTNWFASPHPDGYAPYTAADLGDPSLPDMSGKTYYTHSVTLRVLYPVTSAGMTGVAWNADAPTLGQRYAGTRWPIIDSMTSWWVWHGATPPPTVRPALHQKRDDLLAPGGVWRATAHTKQAGSLWQRAPL